MCPRIQPNLCITVEGESEKVCEAKKCESQECYILLRKVKHMHHRKVGEQSTYMAMTDVRKLK